MKKLLSLLIGAGLVLGAVGAKAGPEQDREALVKYFTTKYPSIKLDNYVYGALAFDPDGLEQYKEIMSFPPFVGVIDAGKKMWDKPFANGKTYASCFPNGGKNIAGNYPYFDNKAGKVVTLNDAIDACRVANGEKPYGLASKEIGVLDSYMRTLSDGMKMNIKVEGPGALAAYEEGKKIFYSRKGQLNFACATCHIQEAGGPHLRSELLSPVIGQATHWPVFRGGEKLVTLQERYAGCFKMIRAVPAKIGSTEMNDLEYFHSYVSNGLPMQASVFRK